MELSIKVPPTQLGVPQHTSEERNARIRRQTEDNILHYGRQGREAID
jgi:hypothetical protein